MEALPDQLILEIFERVESAADRDSFSLTCKRIRDVLNEQRRSICVGCGLNPANEGLSSLCNRFRNLRKVKITYSGWTSKLGKQLDDQGLLVLANNCSSLNELSLFYCTFITDIGLRYLASCSKLSVFNLEFAPRVTGCGVFSLVMGCKDLARLELIRCLNICSSGWIECLGKLGTLSELVIKDCRAIGESDLISLGPSWGKLKRVQFEVDTSYRYMRLYDELAVENWQGQAFPCDNMVELSLVNCIIGTGRGLASVLRNCKNLVSVRLHTCPGLRGDDVIGLAKNSKKLRSISLRLGHPFWLSDDSLGALAANCSRLESVRIFCDGEFPSLSLFTLEGILDLVRACPVRELSLGQVHSFNDAGMEALCSVHSLETLELVRCQEIRDDGVSLVSRFPNLRVLRLEKCLGVTDHGLRPLIGPCKLDQLDVEDCPKITAMGVIGAAKAVSFRHDLSWMH